MVGFLGSRTGTGVTPPRRRVGEVLVGRKLITDEELAHSLKEQEYSGAPLGRILQAQGKMNALAFYEGLAEHLQLPFVNLDDVPPDVVLLEEEERESYLTLSAIPWRKEGKDIIIAAAGVTPELRLWAQEKFSSYRFVITSIFDIYWTVQQHFGVADDRDARELLWRRAPGESARDLFRPRDAVLAGSLLLALLVAAMILPPIWMGLFVAMQGFYLTTLIAKLLVFWVGFRADRKRLRRMEARRIMLGAMEDRDLPIYTLLVPLYHEKRSTVSGLVQSIREMEYPLSKLDIKLIVEADDETTIEHIKTLQCESVFEIVRVPFSMPRTKPKALNYALKFSKGEYATIYDAEDRPDPWQLKAVLRRFSKASADVVCVQCRLNYYNRDETLLTRLFSIEYASWFNGMLPGLEAMKIPIPLGGTSNHFPVRVLRSLLAWDPYNVTEDADLGIRLAKGGYRTLMSSSTTMEEAPISLRAWLTQRTRWIKGHLQTCLVHLRQPVNLWKEVGTRGFFGFLFFLGAPTIVFLTLPIMLLLSVQVAFVEMTLPTWFWPLAVGNLLASILLHGVIAMLVSKREGWRGMFGAVVLFPFYWVLHVAASVRSVGQLLTRPHHWDKTEHGLTSHDPAQKHERRKKRVKKPVSEEEAQERS